MNYKYHEDLLKEEFIDPFIYIENQTMDIEKAPKFFERDDLNKEDLGLLSQQFIATIEIDGNNTTLTANEKFNNLYKENLIQFFEKSSEALINSYK